jgi:hypothetical protein
MRADRFELPLRIVVDDPIPGVVLALQHGAAAKARLVPATRSTAAALAFEFDILVEGALPDGRPRLLGPCVQGPPSERFAYLCVGRMAGQADCQWSGRVKVPLFGLAWELIANLASEQRLEGHIASRGSNGGPALASVKLLPPGWRAA